MNLILKYYSTTKRFIWNVEKSFFGLPQAYCYYIHGTIIGAGITCKKIIL